MGRSPNAVVSSEMTTSNTGRIPFDLTPVTGPRDSYAVPTSPRGVFHSISVAKSLRDLRGETNRSIGKVIIMHFL